MEGQSIHDVAVALLKSQTCHGLILIPVGQLNYPFPLNTAMAPLRSQLPDELPRGEDEEFRVFVPK